MWFSTNMLNWNRDQLMSRFYKIGQDKKNYKQNNSVQVECFCWLSSIFDFISNRWCLTSANKTCPWEWYFVLFWILSLKNIFAFVGESKFLNFFYQRFLGKFWEFLNSYALESEDILKRIQLIFVFLLMINQW